MPTSQNVEAESYLSTKKWFAKYPFLGAPGIPVEPFLSDEQFALEQKYLWPNVWIMVGRIEQIPQAGNYFIKEIPQTNTSLIVVRGRDRVVRALHNVCAHRGSKICWEQSGARGSATSFKCPYHGFTYDLDGKLRYVPDEENFYDFDKNKANLHAVPTDIWEGFIFVHLAPEPRETLRDYIGEIGDGIVGYPFGEQSHQYSYRAILDCNWKLLISSFLEAYHVRALHAAGIRRFTSKDNPHGRLDFVKLLGKHRLISLFINPVVPQTKVAEIAFARLRAIQDSQSGNVVGHRSDAKLEATTAVNKYLIRNIFPNFQLNLVLGGWYAYQFWPLGVDKVLWESRMCFPKPTNATQLFFQYYARYASRENLMEDGNVTEHQHRGLKSGVRKRMVLQDDEIAVQHFNYVVDSYVHAESAKRLPPDVRAGSSV